MNFEEHCIESVKLFGRAYENVHKWLDEFAGSPEFGMKHRKIRHHQAGINQIENLYGIEAAKAAKQHIISDLKQEGWVEGVHAFPKDKEHYIQLGLF